MSCYPLALGALLREGGGFAAFESPDGKFVYYAKFDAPGLWRIAVEGGEERLVLDQLKPGYWALGYQDDETLCQARAAAHRQKQQQHGAIKVEVI